MEINNLGNGSCWITDGDVEPDQNDTLATLDDLSEKLLRALQLIIQGYVNSGADQQLEVLQICVSELLRGASQCRRENKRYEISNDGLN